jgi:site-specific recombinase XerD
MSRRSPGHKSIKTTQRYLGVSTELRREAVNRLHFPEADQAAE